MEVRAEAYVYPTEELDKVRKAVENVVANAEYEVVEGDEASVLVAKARGRGALSKLYNLFRQERILDAARKMLTKGVSGNKIVFYLNKQVAYAGHISFSMPKRESPLGPIKVEITAEDPYELIDWLAPYTIDGKPVTK